MIDFTNLPTRKETFQADLKKRTDTDVKKVNS